MAGNFQIQQNNFVKNAFFNVLKFKCNENVKVLYFI